MLFVVDGDGNVSKAAATALLKDAIAPYEFPAFITSPMTRKSGVGCMDMIDNILDLMHNARLCTVAHSFGILEELAYPAEKIFIVVGADTRPQYVRYCLENNIQVLDLEKGLYPVISAEE